MRGFMIGALLVAVAVIGYLYYQEKQGETTITLEAPTVQTN